MQPSQPTSAFALVTPPPTMQTLTTFLTALLFIPGVIVNAENCTSQAVSDVLQPMRSDPTYTTCHPSTKQTRAFCSSSACQALLSSTLSSDLVPDCNVAIDSHTFSLTDAIVMVNSKCVGPLQLQERVVDKGDVHSKAQHISSHVASALGHSAPMDDVGQLAGTLLFLLRQ
ncbi:Elicitin [Phytophthora infestans]|uniref:Elicitin n=1 Tax=Phytophthora infestans TaxID=4787 RepID=A0A833RUM5_PHYIN|nr:Elicitin [Phytophthora infestans]KAF4146086.1 Elicitin [Phytophthora infestans]